LPQRTACCFLLDRELENIYNETIQLDKYLNVKPRIWNEFANVCMRKEAVPMGFQESFKALSDPTRREIIHLLKKGKLPVGDILAHFDMTGATISHHLSILKDAGLVTSEKKGKFIYYELNLSVVEEIIAWFSGLKEV